MKVKKTTSAPAPAGKSTLTEEQQTAARELLARRPTVIPGTRVILNDKERTVWFDACNKRADELKINAFQAQEFFDLCGVPD